MSKCGRSGKRNGKRNGTAQASDESMRNSADYVKRSRAKLRLSQAQFAEKLGLERRTVMRLEAGDPLRKDTRLAIRYLLKAYIEKHQRIKKDAGAEYVDSFANAED